MRIDDTTVAAYVERLGVLPRGLPLDVERAGDGNINFVRRVRARGDGSVIVKHARPTLERFPQYRAPPERLAFEHAYFSTVRELAPAEASVLPAVLHFSPRERALVLEDLGDAPRLEEEIAQGRFDAAALGRIGSFLGRVHSASRSRAASLAERFRNDGMRELHGEHIFTLPFEPNEFPIPEPLRAEARRLLTDAVRKRIRAMRDRYYGSCEALVHADVQPSNILIARGRARLVDAEIAHVGDPAFDVGTAIAHLRLPLLDDNGATAAERAESSLLSAYRGAGSELDAAAAYAYAGVEMLRRTIGAARAPVTRDPDVAVAAIRRGVDLLRM